jgi:N-methylhydantoinase A
MVADILGNVPCSISSEVSPLAKEYARASTSIIDVYMKIIYSDYTTRLKSGLKKIGFSGQLNFADCAATLIPAEIAMKTPFRVVFAGPAAGTVGSAHFGSLIKEKNLLCADIGGTSCDISLVTNGEPFVNTTFELEHDLVVNALSNDITSIGAGGGSLIAVSATGNITVGPDSAGAEPGPACYGRGGTQPTMTDICVMIGLIDPKGFAGGKMSLDPKLSETSIKNLDTPLSFEQRVQYSFDIGLNNIAEGVFNIAIKNGIDPRDYSLMAFGAAGPLLLPSIAKNIQIKRVIVPPHPGLFSALGLLSADQAFISNRSSYTILSEENAGAIEIIYREMEENLKDDLNLNPSTTFVRTFDAQLVGQTWETPFIEVPSGNITASSIPGMVENFHRVYKERNGNRFDEIPVQGVTYRVKAIIPTDKIDFPQLKNRTVGKAQPIGTTIIRYLSDAEYIAKVYDRASLFAGDSFSGPVIIREALSTTYIPREMTGVIGLFGEIIIESDEEMAHVD